MPGRQVEMAEMIAALALELAGVRAVIAALQPGLLRDTGQRPADGEPLFATGIGRGAAQTAQGFSKDKRAQVKAAIVTGPETCLSRTTGVCRPHSHQPHRLHASNI